MWAPQFSFPKGSVRHWYTSSHLLLQFISFWVILLQLLMKSRYKVGCKLIWVQKLLWIAGGGTCEVGTSLLNQLCYTRNSGTVSKVIFSLATSVCLTSPNSQTGHRTWRGKKIAELEPHQWTTFPKGNLTLALVCKNICRMSQVNLSSSQFSNIETRLDRVLCTFMSGKYNHAKGSEIMSVFCSHYHKH